MAPRAFRTPARFRSWLSRHHATATELPVRCFKTHAAARGMTYAQALDEALCFGWIDGVRRRLDADSSSIRFSPRKSRSIWSRVNVAHVERLMRAGRMTESGLAAFKARSVHWVMSAKREATRMKRLDALIACSGEATRIPPLRRT